MSRIFISHSSKNDAQAICLKQWLVSIDWSRADDIFLDLDVESGISPGERWQKALEQAAARCEAVLFLLSQPWLDSRWCIDEFHLASKLNKRLFPLLLEPLDHSLLPVGLTAHWQIGSLIPDGGAREHFIASHPRLPREISVPFPAFGLAALRRGLEKAGISPDSFKLQIYPTQPPTWRMPYRGLEALEEEDAAVFFGRDAEIVRCIDKLRGLRELASPRMLVILGASGAGKSSFLRAGIVPRLKRDDATWLPLRPVRVARGGAIEGAEGVLNAMAEAHQRVGSIKSRSELEASLATAEGFVGLLTELRAAAGKRAQTDVPPLPVLPIDQAEELFLADAGQEAEHLLTLARAAMEADALLVLATIRTDSYGKLQDAPALAGLHQETLSLGSVLPGEIGRIIREPALRFRRELGPSAPIFHNLVVEKLQEELEGETDALPLLGFALQRLMRAHQSGGTLGLAELEQTGGVTRAIETAAEDAMHETGLHDDPVARREALRAVFVPRLARVDAVSKAVERRVAQMSEVPPELRPLINAFVNKRLLVTKGEGSSATIEVAHEALLRRWPSLTALLEEDRDALLLLDGVLRAAHEWQLAAEQSRLEFLVHRGTRLLYARQLATRGQDWAQEIATADDYLAACTERDASEEAQREASEKRILVGKQRLFAAAAGRMSAERRNDAAMRIALAGEIDPDSIKRGVVADPVRYAQLARAAHDGRLLRIVARLPGAVTCVAFSQDDKLLATGSHDGNARLYDCQTGEQVAAFGSHEGWINSIAFSCDGGRLLSGGRDKTVRIWELATGAELHSLERIGAEVRCVTVSREQFAAGCSDGSISFWDAATFAARSSLNGHSGAVLGLAFDGDGTRLVSGGEDGTVQVWNLADQKSVWKEKLHAEAVNAVTFSPNGASVASASYDHTARLTDAVNGAEIRVLVGHTAPLRSVAFSPDGSRLATSAGDATARIWRIETGREVLRLAGHTGWVHSVAVSHDGRQIATGGFDKTVRLWDANVTKEIVQISGQDSDLHSLGVSPEGGRIALGGTGPIRIYDVESGSEKLCLGQDSGGAGKLSFSPDGSAILAAADDGIAHIWKASDGSEILRLDGRGSKILAAAFNPSGSEVATVGQEGAVRLWDVKTGAEIGSYPPHNDELLDVAFSPDGKLLATGSRSGAVRILQTGTAAETRTIQAHSKPVHKVVFGPDGKKLATAGEEWNARLWDVESGDRLGEMANHGDQVYDVCFSHDGLRLATASRDRVTRLWDAGNCAEIVSFISPEHVHAVAFHPRALFVAVAGKKGLIRVWDTVFLAALSGKRLARAVAGYRLHGAERLTDEEVAELEKFTEPVADEARNVADLVLSAHSPGGSDDEDDQHIEKLVAIWRHYRERAFALENPIRQ
jgi:WD40 repeat protein